ncbi:TonB-dependent receptor [Acidipila sp. EB88]|uniref:TonB-dependent receptor n=1 Tax=Acidipila sp. EB88 TaxID=2305226 RepID=UPI000F5E4EB5|nr:TonB-dependent receptor [Acidipila sp. EB88]RRA49850.1 TonB-dependent receptor [Acidipila sp. EB88]
MKRIQALPLGFLCLFLLPGGHALAQNTNSGDIQGTVTDNTGAVIPGVTITVFDVDKSESRTLTSNDAGVFDTGSIVPDHYKLTFTKPGFTTLVRGPITLAAGTSDLDAQLTVGSENQQVIVNTDLPLLNTESGAVEATLSAKTMVQLPQTGADWQNFIILLPGASGAPENSSNAANPGQVASINGNLPFASMLQDGATTTLPMSQNSDVTIFETTSEVKVSSASFSAQYGVGDIIYNQITKGGSNSFHGVGYEYFQNDALNAAPYGFGQKVTVPNLRYNNFGFSVSGPIIPHKLFFYFDFDKLLDHGTNAASFATVPTAALMAGDFTAPGLPTLYDPTKQTIQETGTHTYTTDSGQAFTQQCPCAIRPTFAAEYGNGNRIPTNMLNPVAQNIQKYFPTANTAGQISSGLAQNNFVYQSSNNNPFTRYFGRADWDIAQNQRLTISQTESDNPQFGYSPVCPINCGSEDVSRENAQISHVWTISPTATNEARFGYTNQLNFFVPSTLNQGFPDQLGLGFAKADNFPNVGINSFYGLASATNAVYKMHVYDPSDVFTLVRGKHVLHFGGEFLINEANSTAWGNINAASVNYNGTYTSINGLTSNTLPNAAGNYASGGAYADFLLGQTTSWSAGVTPEYGGRIKLPQVFVQDDIKLRPNLTVNLGLRYQITTGWSDVKGNEAAFDPEVINPATNTPGAIWYATTHAHDRTSLQAPNYNIWLPRIGFSWQPDSKTVFRGGFGIYASTWSEDTYGGGLGNAFGSSGSLSDNTNGVCPVVQLNADGSTPDTADPGCGVGARNFGSINSKYLTAPTTPDARNGQDVTYNQYHTPIPTNYQYTFDMQEQLGVDFVADIAYVGNHGKNLNFPVDINQVPQNLLGPNDKQSEPYPIYNNISGSPNNAISNYNSLEAQLTKRMSKGLEFNVNYTWSHFLDDQDSSGWGSREGFQNYQNAFDTNANYSNSNFDIRNMFKGQAIYQLPIGRGRMFLNNNLLLDEALGGWQASGTFVVQGGNPISITTGGNNSSNNQSGSATQFANLVGNVTAVPGGRLNRLSEWYNLSALAVPAPYTYGDFRRNTVYGPGLSEFNFSLGKTFNVFPERNVQVQVRADADNVLNHASFGQPGNNAIGPNQSAQITTTTVGGRTMQLYGRVSF